jgi:flagellar basal-body rod modification protein FlgD
MDVRTMNSKAGAPAEGSEFLEQIRKNVGGGFTDKPSANKKKNEMGKDDFMKLMSAQLKYQDPISPMKNEQMAAQLAQFSSLEQMFNVNQNLEKMSAGQKPQENVMAATLIGKKILTDATKLHLEKDKSSNINFELPADVSAGNIAVVDAKGTVVREISLVGAKMGTQNIKWDGKNDKGVTQDPGEYSFRVTAKDKNELPIKAELATAGIVTGVSFEKGRPLLLVGDKKISLDSISRIEEPTAKDLAQILKAQTAPVDSDVKKPASENLSQNNSSSDKQKDLKAKTPQSKIESRAVTDTAADDELSESEQALVDAAESAEGTVADNEAPPLGVMSGTELWNPNN